MRAVASAVVEKKLKALFADAKNAKFQVLKQQILLKKYSTAALEFWFADALEKRPRTVAARIVLPVRSVVQARVAVLAQTKQKKRQKVI